MRFVATSTSIMAENSEQFCFLKTKDLQPSRYNEFHCKKRSLILLGDVPCAKQVSDYFDVKQPGLKEVQIKRNLLKLYKTL